MLQKLIKDPTYTSLNNLRQKVQGGIYPSDRLLARLFKKNKIEDIASGLDNIIAAISKGESLEGLKRKFSEFEKEMQIAYGPSLSNKAPPSKPLILWSGEDAMNAAIRSNKGICNHDILSFNLLFSFWEEYIHQTSGKIPKGMENICEILSHLFVSHFVSKKQGVMVFFSNNKEKEFNFPTMPVHTILWNQEIPLARKSGANIKFYHVKGKNIEEVFLKNISLVRNNGHDFKGNNRNSYSVRMSPTDKENYRKAPKRPTCRVSTIQYGLNHWRNKIHHNKTRRRHDYQSNTVSNKAMKR